MGNSIVTRSGRALDLTGQRFGSLTAICLAAPRRDCNGRAIRFWRCLCDCGKESEVDGHALRSGNTRSCGCGKVALLRSRNLKHGLSHSGAEYRAWQHMRRRCRDPRGKDYSYYGGRGITICERWEDFGNFLADMGPRPSPKHSLERSDVNGPYSPENCRWATFREQMLNKRDNHVLEFRGVRQTLTEWAEQSGLSFQTLRKRIVAGWATERALSEPVRPGRRRTR